MPILISKKVPSKVFSVLNRFRNASWAVAEVIFADVSNDASPFVAGSGEKTEFGALTALTVVVTQPVLDPLFT